MKKISLVLLLLLLVLLAITNPKESEFRDFMEKRIEKQNISGSELEENLRRLVSSPLADLMEEASKRDNYLVFSIFSIESASRQNKYLGIAGQFIPLKEEIGESR